MRVFAETKAPSRQSPSPARPIPALPAVRREVHDLLHGRQADAPEAVARPQGAGQPLDAATRARYEPGLGVSLAYVRVHTDAEAAARAEALDAEAYTVGRDIVFGAGRYAPGSALGERLLAHELAHAVQQRDSSPAGPLPVRRPGDPAEREAERAAGALLAGRPARLAPGSQPVAVHRQPRQAPRRADRFLPNERTQLRQLGRGELDELIDQIIADGSHHQVRRETIDGVEHTWEVKTEIVELSEQEQLEGAKFGGALSDETTESSPDGKTQRHKITFFLRGGRASTIESALHELIHLRIMIDRRLPAEKRSSFYDEYAQLHEMTEVMASAKFSSGGKAGTIGEKASYGALPIAAEIWEREKTVLTRMEAIRSFFVQQDAQAEAAFDKEPSLTPAALIEFIVQEKYVSQAASRAVRGTATSNETVARRYARSVIARFESRVSDAAQRRINGSPVGSRLLAEHLDFLRLAIQRLYETLDQKLREAEEFRKNPPKRPGKLPDPIIFELRPLGIGGQPIPYQPAK